MRERQISFLLELGFWGFCRRCALTLLPQMVNAKKLEKAEAKLKAKQDKRMERDSVKSSGPL